MKKIFAVLLLALLAFPSALAVSSGSSGGGSGHSNSDYIYTSYGLNQGWNLLPYVHGIDFEGLDEEDLEGAYVYNPEHRTYYDILEDDDHLEEIIDEYGFTSIWIFMSDDAHIEIEIDRNEVQSVLENTKVHFDGGEWYFHALNPFMLEASNPHWNFHKNDYGDSEIKSMYFWDSDSQEWEDIREEFIEWAEYEEEEDVFLPVLVKYYDEFSPSFESVEIPAFPEY